MLRIVAIALLATTISVGLAEAKGAKKSLPVCQTEQQTKAPCACGPAKTVCKPGQWCHGFTNACTQ
jgi:hypothetical protein